MLFRLLLQTESVIEMTDEDIQELLPVVGDRIQVRKLLKGVMPQDGEKIIA